VNASAVDRRIRDLRPRKAYVDPYTAHGSLLEEERRPSGQIERAVTVFLAGAECPFTCSFCDLWRFTIDGPTPPGALTSQLERVIRTLDRPLPNRLKLYNASNFFDQLAVPAEDLAGIARLAAPFVAVTVESHVNTIGDKALAFARQIPGRLEVAVGLETIHPVAITQINKRLDLTRFESAAQVLSANGIDLRVFVLLGAPYVPADESVDWTVRSVEFAVERGASVVSIVSVRGGNGELERLQTLGAFVPSTLWQLEEALDRCSHLTGAVVTADLWDVERLATCRACRPTRVQRLELWNLTGRREQRISCAVCGTA
jgi:radical SAM enzyme (TIGR01210 family)